jgi:hypothetical protein
VFHIPEHFFLEELVCPDVYKKWGYIAWSFFDDRLLTTIETIRNKLGKPIYVNNWDSGGDFDERGLRCNFCNLVKTKTAAGILYLSPHIRGCAVDFDVEGMTAEEVRQWLVKNKIILPYAIRLENNVNWVHLDVAPVPTLEKVTLFNP